jgi:hypothetical protein
MMNDQSQSSVAALRAKSFRGHMNGLDGVRGLTILVVLFHNVGYFEEPADGLAIKILRAGVGAGRVGGQLFFRALRFPHHRHPA